MLTLRQPEHDPMLTNAPLIELAARIESDFSESPKARELALRLLDTDLEQTCDELCESLSTEEDAHVATQKELEDTRDALEAFRAVLLSVHPQLHESDQKEIDSALAEFPSAAEVAERARQEEASRALWSIRHKHGRQAADLMGKPARFEYREYRARTWKTHDAVQTLAEGHLADCEVYRMSRGKEISESRWVPA